MKIFEGGEMNGKECFGDFIVGFGVGRVPLVAWWSWWSDHRYSGQNYGLR